MKKLLVACLIALALPSAHAAPPRHVELTFDIALGRMKLGEGRDVLDHDGSNYRVVSETIPKGIAAVFIDDIRRESRGRVTASGLKPERFEENGRKGGPRIAEFDWTAGKLRLIDGDNNTLVDLPTNTVDQACLPYGFAFLPPEHDDFKVFVTDGRRVADYRYRMIGRETVRTALGELETLHFEKVRDPDDKRGFEFWLAVDRYYLPVKLRFVEKNGSAFDSIVTGIKY